MGNKFLIFLILISFVFVLHADISVSVPEKSVAVKIVNGYAKFINNTIYSDPGCPVLPSKSYSFLVSPNTDLSSVSFEIQGLTEKSLKGTFNVKPARPPMSINGPEWPESRSIVNGKDVGI